MRNLHSLCCNELVLLTVPACRSGEVPNFCMIIDLNKY